MTIEQQTELAAICMRLAPEARVYVVARPEGMAANPRIRAFVCPRGINFLAREQLIRQGRWAGPGVAITLLERFDEVGDALPVALHELAHALPYVPPADVAPIPEIVEFQRLAFSVQLSGQSKPDVETWLGHGVQFIRAALHLHWRAWHYGHEPSAGEMQIAGECYGTSGWWHYRDALGNEPENMRNEAFDTILATAAPEAFSGLFRADTERWRGQQEGV